MSVFFYSKSLNTLTLTKYINELLPSKDEGKTLVTHESKSLEE